MEGLSISLWVLVVLVVVALAFDFMNGFHDGANSISTIVATGVLTPKQAVLFAAFFNFAALWVFHLKVAATIGKGTVDPNFVDHYVIFGALCGALAWNIITWVYGIPSSSSHALVGGLVGATVAKAGGIAPIIWHGFGQIVLFIVISPFVGFMLGGLLMVLVAWLFRDKTPGQVAHWFRYGQVFASGAYSLTHGGNDAQKTIGVIWLLLISAGVATTDIATLPSWVVYACYLSIAWGTYLGGWRIVKTMGTRITKLNTVSASCASMSGAISLALANLGGIPVSTTHTIAGAIAGSGAAHNVKRVRWDISINLAIAWVLTIPASALIASLFWWLGTHFL
ncbi:MAG TPA: inorganic phosphate transporter [Thiobacillaceae bacterium]|nr:inorganic phosphate transporter [Thiobacillaceae bacterium]HNA82449.1 inorganic phosphate transporter [Thiobacillaceae bacterium]HNF89067.1 inorganic phosphate transporter [Thiobacillaceae bacterium]HNH88695.1 inorganic phosphate transporter [Thiobacillaceae bacterium]HNI07311.1 inorganic phosphate transporter [Thiobacillaceae bacterium]